MIFHGPKLLAKPGTNWKKLISGQSPGVGWLVASSLTASIPAAIAVVVGHLGSAALLETPFNKAAMRAATSLISITGGILIIAMAFTLLLIRSANAAHCHVSPGKAMAVTMGILWPVWFSGLIQAVVLLVGGRTIIAQAAWFALAVIIAAYFTSTLAAHDFGIHRRWIRVFRTHALMYFVLLFSVVVIFPPVFIRHLTNLESKPEVKDISTWKLPVPEKPNW